MCIARSDILAWLTVVRFVHQPVTQRGHGFARKECVFFLNKQCVFTSQYVYKIQMYHSIKFPRNKIYIDFVTLQLSFWEQNWNTDEIPVWGTTSSKVIVSTEMQYLESSLCFKSTYFISLALQSALQFTCLPVSLSIYTLFIAFLIILTSCGFPQTRYWNK